jgi:hypothetical protein
MISSLFQHLLPSFLERMVMFNSSKEKFEIFRVLGMNEVCNCSQITQWNSIMQFLYYFFDYVTRVNPKPKLTTNEIMKAF